MDRFNFYTSPEVYATIGMVSKKMLDNTSSKMVLSSIHLDFQPVAPSYIFQIFLRIAIQNQIYIMPFFSAYAVHSRIWPSTDSSR